jgi:hypothetical protein
MQSQEPVIPPTVAVVYRCIRCGEPYAASDGIVVCDRCIAEQIPPTEYAPGGLVYPYATDPSPMEGMEAIKSALHNRRSSLLVNTLILVTAFPVIFLSLLGIVFLPWEGRAILIAVLFAFLTLAVLTVIERPKLVREVQDLERRLRLLRLLYTDAALRNRVVRRRQAPPVPTPGVTSPAAASAEGSR